MSIQTDHKEPSHESIRGFGIGDAAAGANYGAQHRQSKSVFDLLNDSYWPQRLRAAGIDEVAEGGERIADVLSLRELFANDYASQPHEDHQIYSALLHRDSLPVNEIADILDSIAQGHPPTIDDTHASGDHECSHTANCKHSI